MAWHFFLLAFIWVPLDMQHSPKDRNQPSTPPHDNDSPLAVTPQQGNAPAGQHALQRHKNCAGMTRGT